MAVSREDKGRSPGTQTANTPEGAVADGLMQIEVRILVAGTPAAVAADYATLLTNVSALTTAKTIRWEKR